MAERTLRVFTDLARELGVHAGAYFCALDAWFRTLRLTVEAKPGSELARAALAHARRSDVIVYGENRGRIIPCLNAVCYEPLRDAASIARFFKNLPKP